MVDFKTRDILGVRVVVADRSEAIARIAGTVEQGEYERYAFLNAHGANVAYDDPQFRSLLDEFTILPDGAGVDIASRWLYGAAFPANLNGTDFVPALLAAPNHAWRVGLLGAQPGVADEAARRWGRAFPAHGFEVIAHGYVEACERASALAELAKAPTDLLLVAMGNPAQERFIAKHIGSSHTRVAMGVGALLDFAAGRVRRAPVAVRRARSEWMFRLALEPTRLSRRYLLGNPLFLARVLNQRRRRG